MLEGLYAAAAGMSAQQEQMDSIGNDLANISTTGYRAERVGFQDLLYNQVNQAGTSTTTGAGARAQTVGWDPTQGSLQQTGQPLDLAIQGEGFFQIKQPNGTTALTRDGSFTTDAQGNVVTSAGAFLDPPVKLPSGVSPSEVNIASDGTVRAGTRSLGQIKLVTVPSPDHLLADGSGAFTPTAGSGAVQVASGATIHQGELEGSNVNMATEMTTMVSTQRNYQLASTAIQTQDQMLGIANQLVSPS
jgi:flagellar basal-body rod protein FlgG